jgi:single-strand DNA-binding protein
MASFNKVILMGNLTRDPETRYSGNGNAIVKFGLAVNERFQGADGQWQDRPTFIDVTMFGKRGEAFAKFHTKGKPAFVEGKLRLDTWDDKEGGGKRSKLYVVADNFEFVGGREGGGREGGGPPQREGAAPAPAGNFGEGGGWDQPGPDADFSDTPF